MHERLIALGELPVKSSTMILVEEAQTPLGHIKIMRSKIDGSISYYQDACFHGQITKNGVSTCGYVHVLRALVKQSQARRVLMIGCAGGTLATMLHHDGCIVTVVDINPHAFNFAHKYFGMPTEIECIEADGIGFIAQVKTPYDAIVIDAFDSKSIVPDAFTSEAFFRSCIAALQPDGILAMNVMVGHDFDTLADKIALRMEAAGLPATMFDRPSRRDRNVIIAGGKVEHLQVPVRRMPGMIREDLEGLVKRDALRLKEA